LQGRDANAGCQIQFSNQGDSRIVSHKAADPFSNHDGAPLIGVGQKDREFFSANSRQ